MGARMSREKSPAWYRFSIGAFNATIISDGELTFGSTAAEFPQAPEQELRRLLDREFLPETPLVLQENCLVLDTGKQLILFDSGFGEVPLFGTDSGRLLNNLASAGIAPGDIDIVILTHPHPDHAWGLTDAAGNKRFPNAKLFMSKRDFDFWTDEAKLADENSADFIKGARKAILPYRKELNLIEKDEEVVPGISAIWTPGHTIGHTSFLIRSGDDAVLNLGDICHHYALLFPYPAWEYRYDTDSKLAVQSRIKTFNRAVEENITLIGYHFPFPGLGRIIRENDAFRYVPRHLSFV